MDAGTLIRTVAAPDAGASSADRARLAGEVLWCIGADGRLETATGRRRGVGRPIAGGRVCPETGIGVIEQLDGRAAVLGLLPRGVVDLLGERFPGVRWAVADVGPSVMAGTQPH
jgi:hypothetical protein